MANHHKLPFAVCKLHKPQGVSLHNDVLAQFLQAHDAIFYAKNYYRANSSKVESVRVFDVNNVKPVARFPELVTS